jgi:hypothetical protein
MAAAQLLKSHKSTVCIVPPLAVQQAIQRVRCFRDKSFVRWPPHINLLYPFLDADGGGSGASSSQQQGVFGAAADAATQALAQLPPFTVTFRELSWFAHGSRSYTMWLKPADTTGLSGCANGRLRLRCVCVPAAGHALHYGVLTSCPLRDIPTQAWLRCRRPCRRRSHSAAT